MRILSQTPRARRQCRSLEAIDASTRLATSLPFLYPPCYRLGLSGVRFPHLNFFGLKNKINVSNGARRSSECLSRSASAMSGQAQSVESQPQHTGNSSDPIARHNAHRALCQSSVQALATSDPSSNTTSEDIDRQASSPKNLENDEPSLREGPFNLESSKRTNGPVQPFSKSASSSLKIRRVYIKGSSHFGDPARSRSSGQLNHAVTAALRWRTQLRLLEMYTLDPSPAQESVRVMFMVPTFMVTRLHLMPGGTLWDLARDHDCHLNLLGDAHSTDGKRPLIAIGRSSSLAKVWQRLGAAVSEHQGSEVEVIPVENVDKYQLPDRHLVRTIATSKETRAPIRADLITRPTKWNTLTLASYVRDLCEPRMPRMMHRQLYRKGEEHAQLVTAILVEIFSDRAALAAVTTTALNYALNFLEHHRNLPAARDILQTVVSMGLQLHVSTFNIMLRGFAAADDMKGFLYLLRQMIRHGTRPDGHTWVAFLNCPLDLRLRMHIVDIMRKRGLLEHKHTLQDTVAVVLPDILAQWLDGGQDLVAFFHSMNGFFGPDWFFVGAVNRMLHVLGNRGRFGQCIDLWTHGVERGIDLDAVTFNTMLRNCALGTVEGTSREVLDRAQQVVALAEARWIKRNAISYQILFRLACSSRLYNAARVAWQYACMEGQVSYMVQAQTKQSLLTNVARHKLGRSASWMTTSGKVMMGIATPAPLPSTSDDGRTLPNTGPNRRELVEIMSRLCDWRPAGPERDQALSVAKQMLQRDLEASRWVRPGRPLSEILRAALILDEQWKQRETSREEMSGAWRIQHAIDVPTKPVKWFV